ncbi:TPA: NACHT domain-containing protein [Vibrio diabolicus]
MKALVENLIEHTENLYLEFKSQWYWTDKSAQVGDWGEFLKDFSALVNCCPEHVSSDKYLFIGIDETKEGVDRLIDTDINDIGYPTLEAFKEKIDEKLQKFFHFERDDVKSDYYEIRQDELNGKRIIYFVIKPVFSLMELKVDLRDKKRTEKKGNVFVRGLKSSGDPEVKNANPSMITSFKSECLLNVPDVFKERNIGKNVEKTIKSFLQKNQIFKESGSTKEKKWKEKILFEVYNLKSDFTSDIDFIYLFKDSNQTKTRDYLLENGYISDGSIKYVLIDDGLRKDISGISSKFKADKVYSLSEFALKHLYEDLLDEENFHDGQFKKQKQIQNFIEPSAVNSKDKSALVILNEWFSKSSNPLLVIKGYGGVGKTTLVKYFLDKIYWANRINSDSYRILFIDSKKIIDEISLEGNIDNLFYFYSAHAKINEFEKRLNQELLELSIDNGNLLIVVDGIDEVIAKLSNKFNVKKFISSIFENYLIGNEKTKIILTCRDYFWDANAEEGYNISKLNLSPFTEKLAKKFFSKEYEQNSKEFKSCMQYANQFKFESGDGEHVYIPYILDVIMDMVKQNRDLGEVSRDDIESSILNSSLTDDYFVGRICNREIEKLNNLSIDEQLMFFMKISVKYNGYIHDSNFSKIMPTNFDSEELENLFKGHPLISYDPNSKITSFKYDFFKEYFINLYLCNFLLSLDKSNFDQEVSDIICEFVKYNNSFSNRIAQRVDLTEELELLIIEVIEMCIDKIKRDQDFQSRKLISSLTCILLSCHEKLRGKLNVTESTQLIYDIFGKDLSYLSIINFFGEDKDKLVFDFRGREIHDAWFENYPFFWECKFDKDTSFISSTFKHLEPKNNITLPKIGDSLFVKCDTSGIAEIIKSSDQAQIEKDHSIRDDIKRIFRLFDNAGTFKEQKVEYIEKHSNAIILKKLVKKKIINPYKNPKKPRIKQYKISDNFYDIIKVLDQNGTNYELERVIKMIRD